jgi:hypothetical protein
VQSVRALLIALLLLVTGCTSDGADKRTSDSCRAGVATQCHDMFEQNKGGQNNGSGMGGGARGGMGGGMM